LSSVGVCPIVGLAIAKIAQTDTNVRAMEEKP